MKKNISINLDISVINFLEQLSKMENRNKSNLLNEIIKNYYENLTFRQQIKLSRIENIFENGDKLLRRMNLATQTHKHLAS